MSSERIRSAVRDLWWSAFTELGVPGVVRHHQDVAIDPEPLVVTAPGIFGLDARLRDQIYAWCATHGSKLSASRLQGLARQLGAGARYDFASFAATLRAEADVRWSVAGEPWSHPPEVRPPPLPLERPALIRLRLRALCGVGARADVLCELLPRGDWVRAADLASEGYSKRSIANILAELAAANIAQSRPVGNAIVYRLGHADLLGQLVGPRPSAFPRWRQVVALALETTRLAELEAKPATVRRVEATRARENLAQTASELMVAEPPPTRGHPDGWARLVEWCADQVETLASGASVAMQPTSSSVDPGQEERA